MIRTVCIIRAVGSDNARSHYNVELRQRNSHAPEFNRLLIVLHADFVAISLTCLLWWGSTGREYVEAEIAMLRLRNRFRDR